MKKKKVINWYIFTDDSFTNRVISRELPFEDTVDGVMCYDGIERKMWKCSGPFVTKILKNKKQEHLSFDIFKREGAHGSIKKCEFFNKKKNK